MYEKKRNRFDENFLFLSKLFITLIISCIEVYKKIRIAKRQ